MTIYDFFCHNFDYYKPYIPQFIYDEYDIDKFVMIDDPDCDKIKHYYDYDLTSSSVATHLHFINNIWRLIVKYNNNNEQLNSKSKKELSDFVVYIKNDYFIKGFKKC